MFSNCRPIASTLLPARRQGTTGVCVVVVVTELEDIDLERGLRASIVLSLEGCCCVDEEEDGDGLTPRLGLAGGMRTVAMTFGSESVFG